MELLIDLRINTTLLFQKLKNYINKNVIPDFTFPQVSMKKPMKLGLFER